MANANKQAKSMIKKGGSQNNSPLALTVKEYTLTRIADAEIPTAILENGEPFLSWKILVEEGLKTHWKTQKKKEKELLEKGVVILTLPFKTKGGMQKMKAISLFDIPAYLYTISANRVRQELREKVKQIQIETTKAIRNYWKEKVIKEKEEIEKAKAQYDKLVAELKQIPTYEEYQQAKELADKLQIAMDMIEDLLTQIKPHLKHIYTWIEWKNQGFPTGKLKAPKIFER